jgi:hypothetical protein
MKDTNEIKEPVEPAAPVKRKFGGAQPGAGRPKGSKNAVTIENLLMQIAAKNSGRNYEELLVEDFMKARSNGDTQLMLKYHNLILNKVMHNLNKVEVTDSEDAVEAKKAAFAAALAKLTGLAAEDK